MEGSLFDQVADALRGMAPPGLGGLRFRSRRYGIKVWFGSDHPSPEHYEAQVIGPADVDGARVLALEVGFHAEHREVTRNEEVVAHLVLSEDDWRRVLGDEPVAGPFVGRPEVWRRVSETWPDPDLGAADLALELAARLADYITALEPVRRSV